MLVLHALGGCDTTSALYGIGKGKVYTLFKDDERNQVNLEILHSPYASVEEVTRAGIPLMVELYGGKSGDTLSGLRYAAYCKRVSSSFHGLQPERLPPSEDAARLHILRVHLQAVTWKLLGGEPLLQPLSWGCKVLDR